jgi:hypothetical protein
MPPTLSGGPLSPRRKWQVIVGVFVACWILYFVVPCITRQLCLDRLSNLFAAEALNLVFLMILFLTISILAADAAEYLYLRVRRLPWFRPRLGEVLVTRGFITEQELSAALAEQKLRIGELLQQAGRAAPIDIERALEYQQSCEGVRIGEALVELGCISRQDVSWALTRLHRKLGKILLDQQLISEFDLRRTLGRMWYGRNHGL